MPDRKALLRVMLWLLGLAAASGVLAALFFPRDVAWRTVGTLVLGAITCGVMTVGVTLTQHPPRRRGGLFLMIAAIIEFIGVLTLIWEIFGSWWLEEKTGMSLLAWGGVSIWLTWALAMWERPMLAVAARFAVGLACVTLPMWLIGIWSSSQSDWAFQDHMLEAGWAIALFGLAAVALLLDYAPGRWWMWLGLLAAAAACAMWQGHIWLDLRSGSGIAECVASLSILLAYLSVLRLARLRASVQWVQKAAMIAAVVTAVCADVMILVDKHDPGGAPEILARLMAASSIATACATLALLVLWRLGWRDLEAPAIAAIRELVLICPGCGKKATRPVGISHCPHCRLEFDLQVREPRCRVCNYVLYMLQSDRCPECGNVIELDAPGRKVPESE